MALPGDLEIDLYRISNGEPIRWSGLSSGQAEKVQGAVLMGAGGLMALVTGPGAFSHLLQFASQPDRGMASLPIDALFLLISCAPAVAALAIAYFGWRTYRTAGRVAWAVTTKRLIRMIGGEADRAQSWPKAEILKYERMAFGNPPTEALVVTVRGRGRRREAVLRIMGPSDLADAERALAALES